MSRDFQTGDRVIYHRKYTGVLWFGQDPCPDQDKDLYVWLIVPDGPPDLSLGYFPLPPDAADAFPGTPFICLCGQDNLSYLRNTCKLLESAPPDMHNGDTP